MGKGFGYRKTKKGKPNHNDYRDFLLQVLNATNKSKGKSQVVYPLLEKNLDKLDDNFAKSLRSWATKNLSTVAVDQSLPETMAGFSCPQMVVAGVALNPAVQTRMLP